MSNHPEPGTVLLGKYLVESLIGEGGMGVVVKAKHIALDENVAIKCLLPEMMARTDIVARFLREAKAAVKLKGEHVARVLDVGRLESEIPYICMEYLDGADLNAIVKHYGAQDPAVATDLMLQACEAIAEAHSLGIIHRDIKASNFFVTQPPNAPPVLKVLDFGIATAPEGTSDLTSTQSVIGTPAYMAPEQMRSSRTADARSDIWSMGVVLYELIEGRRPFLSEVYSELCLKVGMDPPGAMVAPGVPDGLRAVVLKCLEKPLEDRYQSVAELAFDLLPYATDQVAARAMVEQCSRLLGRRSAPGQENRAPRLAPGADATPALLGRPTPTPSSTPKTPTSIGQGSGEVTNPPSASSVSSSSSLAGVAGVSPPSERRRGGMIALVALGVIAIGVAGIFAVGHGGGTAASSLQPAAQPTPMASTPGPVVPVPVPVLVQAAAPAAVAPPAAPLTADAPPPAPAAGSGEVSPPATSPTVAAHPTKQVVHPHPTRPTPHPDNGDIYTKRQ